jgi:hypothetical protein
MGHRLPRCPYARAELEDSLVSRCSSFKPADLVFEVTGIGGETPNLEVAVGRSCAYLSLQPNAIDFGYVSACCHPSGPPSVATIEVVGRPAAAPRGVATSPA